MDLNNYKDLFEDQLLNVNSFYEKNFSNLLKDFRHYK